MRYHTITVLSVMGLAAVLFGCSTSETRSSRTTITHNPPETAPGTSTSQTMRESDMRPMLSDANILAIIEAANTGEVQEGQLAQQRASNPQVRLFASKVTQDHRVLLEQGSNLASRMNITPSLPRDSRNMTAEHQAAVDSLKAKSGEALTAPTSNIKFKRTRLSCEGWTRSLWMRNAAICALSSRRCVRGFKRT
jgi:predicted outer membrane protein